jgi:hypothetical protein
MSRSEVVAKMGIPVSTTTINGKQVDTFRYRLDEPLFQNTGSAQPPQLIDLEILILAEPILDGVLLYHHFSAKPNYEMMVTYDDDQRVDRMEVNPIPSK